MKRWARLMIMGAVLVPLAGIMHLFPTDAQTTPDVYPLRVWLPGPLAPLDNPDIQALIDASVDAFERANPDTPIEIRRKRYGEAGASEVGGLLATLRSAAAVAPATLPDIALIRIGDLGSVAAANLLYPLAAGIPTTLLSNLYPMAARAGMVNGETLAIAYALDVQHLAIPAGTNREDFAWSLDRLLTETRPFVFPAGGTNALNPLFYAQYLAEIDSTQTDDATATITPPDAPLRVEGDALRRTLRFYELALEAEVISPDVVGFTRPEDYADRLRDGEVAAGVVTSRLYQQLIEEGVALDYALFPTRTGAPITVVDGWMWVFVTRDAARQGQALRFIEGWYDVERHAAHMEALGLLPSQPSALSLTESSDYRAFLDQLINNAVLPPTLDIGSPARAMQSAFTAVLQGELTAADAAREVSENDE